MVIGVKRLLKFVEENRLPRTKSPWFSFVKKISLFTASLHPRTDSPRYSRSLNKLVEDLSDRELKDPEGSGFDLRLGEVHKIESGSSIYRGK